MGELTSTEHGDGATDEAARVPSSADSAEVVTALTDLLVKAVRALGAAGQPEQASRISGKAWWVLQQHPRQAERINGTMHYLAKLEQATADE